MTIHVERTAPWFHRAPTREIEPPFRVCLRSVVFRLWPTGRAWVFGRWRPSGLSETEALQRALAGRMVDLDTEVDLDDPEVRRTIRDNVARLDLDPDAEWQLIDMLGMRLAEDEA
jgi:hypothetical protein